VANIRFFKWLLPLFVLSVMCSLAPGVTFYVSQDEPNDYNSIQAAINDANDGDIIEIKPGTYTSNGNTDIDPNGKAITIRSITPEDPNIVASTIIDCNGAWLNGHRGFCFHSGEDANFVLDGLTIKNGFAYLNFDSNDRLENGGGILVINSSPTIRNCIFENNTAEFSGGMGTHGGAGGGICCYDKANPLITNCSFISNNCNSAGAAIACYSSNPIIINCVIKNNFAMHGGGIFCNENSAPLITDCTITNNHVSGSGAGIYSFLSAPTILNCTISSNSAGNGPYGNGYGGGIAAEDGNVLIKNNCPESCWVL